MIDKIEERARRALRDPKIAWLFEGLPARLADDPRVLKHLLVSWGDGNPVATDSPAYQRAFAAVDEVQNARELRDRIATIYHDPKLRAEIGVERLEQAWRDPETAYAELIKRSATGRLSPSLDAALNALGEVREFAAASGAPISPQAPAANPLPSAPSAVEAEIKELLHKSVAGKLSAAEDARLDQLYAARVGRDEAGLSHRETATAPAPSEFDRLIQKSVSGRLSSVEDARLNELSQARAAEQGLVEQDDQPARGGNFEEANSGE